MWILLWFAFILCYLLFKIHKNIQDGREWDEGLFNGGLFNEYDANNAEPHDPMLEAYISLAAMMVRKDTSSYGEKLLYLNSYFSKTFPKSHYNFGSSFVDALKNPVQPEKLAKWLNKEIHSVSERIQILYFLAGLSTVDGSMNSKEIELLRTISDLLQLSTADFDRVIAMYTQRQERERAERNQESTSARKNALTLAYRILGVSDQSPFNDIKKAYRNLVKLHHPDCFATQSLEQQKLAQQKFVEIQKAYELIEKNPLNRN